MEADIRYNKGPLTTTWTWPDVCNLPYCDNDHPASAWVAQKCSGVMEYRSCWPSQTATGTAWYDFHKGFYSPGLLCPSGFTPACSSTYGGFGNMPQLQSLIPDETAIGCCPTCVLFL